MRILGGVANLTYVAIDAVEFKRVQGQPVLEEAYWRIHYVSALLLSSGPGGFGVGGSGRGGGSGLWPRQQAVSSTLATSMRACSDLDCQWFEQKIIAFLRV